MNEYGHKERYIPLLIFPCELLETELEITLFLEIKRTHSLGAHCFSLLEGPALIHVYVIYGVRGGCGTVD